MNKLLFTLYVVLSTLPIVCFGQDGTDISQAIPIYFGQTINSSIDSSTVANQVYSITFGKGQQLSVTATTNQKNHVGIVLFGSDTHTIVGAGNGLASANGAYGPLTFSYTVTTPGVYYIDIGTNTTSVTYSLQVTSTGPIIPTNICTPASTVTGTVDFMTYSLGLVAAGLPDAASIGGTQLCATCAMKPPAYPALVAKLEKALGLNLNVAAGFDTNGNMCQIKLLHP